MIDWAHIAERAVIHYFASAGVYLPMLWLAWVGERKRWWPPLRGWWELALPAGVSWAAISTREVWDVAAGGSPVKSVADWLSWLAGLGTAVWLVYRLAPRLWAVLLEIEEDDRRDD